MSGLLSFAGGVAKYGLRQEERRQDEASEERKAQRRKELELELMRAKEEYARANPRYQRFMEDEATGSVYGYDEFGGSKLLKEASPQEIQRRAEERDLKRRGAEADILGRESQAAAALENAASNAEYRKAAIDARNRAITERSNRPSGTGGRIEPTETQLKASVISALQKTRPDLFLGGQPPEEGDPEYDEYNDLIEEEIAARRAARGSGRTSTPAPSTDDPFSGF